MLELLGKSPFIALLVLVPVAAITASPGQASVSRAPAPSQLLIALKSRDAETRRQAANQLGALRAQGAVRWLIEALSDKEDGVREAAAFALGQIHEPAAVAPLIHALADHSIEVRASAAFALGMLENRKATEALLDALEDSAPEVRSSAAAAFGLLQESEAIDELITLLDDPSFDVRYDAVWALGQIGDPDAEVPLQTALASSDQLQVNPQMREAFRQAVENSLESLRTGEDKDQARPRRAVRPKPETTHGTSQPATIRQTVQPAPTEHALLAHVTGVVSLRVLVGAEGRAVRAYVTRRLGYGLDRRAIEAVMQYRFDPPILDGLPQTEWINLDVKFRY
jgi:HEAT repeat protein